MKVLVEGTCTLDLLADPLRHTLADAGETQAEVVIGAYDHWRQTLLSPAREMKRDPPEGVFVVLDGRTLFARPGRCTLEDVNICAERIRTDTLRETVEVLDAGLTNFPTSHFIVTTPISTPGAMLGSLAARSHSGLAEAVEDFNRGLRQWAASTSRSYVLDMGELVLRHGLAHICDDRLWFLARCPWSREGMRRIADRFASLWTAIHGKQRKCLIVDLDNTLWGGVLGEDGFGGIRLGHEGIGAAYREFQTCLRHLRTSGVILAIVSKNDQAAAWDVVERHPGMILRPSDFCAVRINWHDKARNVGEIAAELNIALDALVFLDDDPAERDRIRAALPEVAVPDWPDEATALPVFAEDLVWRYFNRVSVTKQDAERTDLYQAESRRRALRGKGVSLEEWLASLNMRSHILLPEPAVLPRFAQLTQKTNQFNVTARRYTEAQIARLARNDDWIVIGADLSDRFGDSGIVALAMLERVGAATWRIDSFLLSCRVIGRTLEQSLLHGLATLAYDRGATSLHAEHRPTPRNGIVRDLWAGMGFSREHSAQQPPLLWSLDLTARLPAASQFITTILPETVAAG